MILLHGIPSGPVPHAVGNLRVAHLARSARLLDVAPGALDIRLELVAVAVRADERDDTTADALGKVYRQMLVCLHSAAEVEKKKKERNRETGV